jgi:hypothetical protein
MVSFQTKNPNFGKFWRALHRFENVDIFSSHLDFLQTFGMFYAHLVHFVFIWYIFSGLGIMLQEKSGNPERNDNILSVITVQVLPGAINPNSGLNIIFQFCNCVVLVYMSGSNGYLTLLLAKLYIMYIL